MPLFVDELPSVDAYLVGTQDVHRKWNNRPITGQCGLFCQLVHFLCDILHPHAEVCSNFGQNVVPSQVLWQRLRRG